MIKIVSLFVFCLLFDSYNSCGSKKHYLKKDQIPIDSTEPLTFAAKILGGNVQLEQYNNLGYQNKRGQAESGSDLSCNLNSDCCWRNSDHPYDTMEFVRATGTPDSPQFENFFKTSEKPSKKAHSKK
uniref:Uncharacterized protein n=1 Tax=Romanomermis culicivorax TaxID=13658 RepID=A0A915I254_ROMCU